MYGTMKELSRKSKIAPIPLYVPEEHLQGAEKKSRVFKLKLHISTLLNFTASYDTNVTLRLISCAISWVIQCVIPCTIQCVIPCTIQCVIPCTIQCVIPCTIQCVIPYVIQCVIPCTIQCVIYCYKTKKCVVIRFTPRAKRVE